MLHFRLEHGGTAPIKCTKGGGTSLACVVCRSPKPADGHLGWFWGGGVLDGGSMSAQRAELTR